METFFSDLFEDLRYERSLVLVLSITDPDTLKLSKFTDDEVNIIKSLALEKKHREKMLKENVAMDLLEKQFSKK